METRGTVELTAKPSRSDCPAIYSRYIPGVPFVKYLNGYDQKYLSVESKTFRTKCLKENNLKAKGENRWRWYSISKIARNKHPFAFGSCTGGSKVFLRLADYLGAHRFAQHWWPGSHPAALALLPNMATQGGPAGLIRWGRPVLWGMRGVIVSCSPWPPPRAGAGTQRRAAPRLHTGSRREPSSRCARGPRS